MQPNDVQDDQTGQREASRAPLGVLGGMGVVAGLTTPLTLGLGLLVAFVLALTLAFQRRWTAVAWVLGAASIGFTALLLLGMLDPSQQPEVEIFPADPDFTR
jgi:hypothetical protein